MLCAVAIIGAGYAAFSNTAKASTYNENNTVDVGYMRLTPGDSTGDDWDAITTVDLVKFSTYTYNNSGTKNAYYFADNDGQTTVGVYTAVPIGNKTFRVDNDTGSSISTVSLTAKQNRLVGNTGIVFIMKVGNVVNVLDSTGDITEKTFAVTLDGNTSQEGDQPVADEGSALITVELYIGYNATEYIKPADMYGVPHDSTDGGYSVGVKTLTTPPASDTSVVFNNLAFTFDVIDTTPASP